MIDVSVLKITEGLGFGHGNIGVTPRLEAADDALDETTLARVDVVIESSEILTPVDRDDNGKQIEDDGCGDGRGVGKVMEGDKERKRSLNRPKVFGGGATMDVAGKIANGHQDSLQELFKKSINDLDIRNVPFGAHTDDHAHGANCGCGAIDKAPQIIANAIQFKDEIMASVQAVTGLNSSENLRLQEAFHNFELYAAQHTDDEYTGAAVMEKIVDSGKIVKQLVGPHLETRIVINTVPDYTVNQKLVREVSEDKAQVFAVDEWRLQQLSDKMNDADADKERAYYGMLIYTLATAGTLTVGDLGVYAVLPTQLNA